MGLFSTVLHLYKKEQKETIHEFINELSLNYGVSKFTRLPINNANHQNILDSEVYSQQGVFYLVTQPHGNWITIIELNVNMDHPFHLNDLTNQLSRRLDTYALSFYLHDDDVLYYNLDKQGKSLDGYNSDYQYFLVEPASREEVLSQRHTPQHFIDILPKTKKVDKLNEILNEGYWNAFDNDDLDEDGVPNDEKYFVDEEDRFTRVGKYLEIFSKDEYPFANWYMNLKKINFSNCYLLKGEK